MGRDTVVRDLLRQDGVIPRIVSFDSRRVINADARTIRGRRLSEPWWKIICQRPISPAHGNIMKKINAGILATMSLAVVSSVASAQTSASQTTLVTVENYNRAQTDVNFAGVVRNGGFRKIPHGRQDVTPPPISHVPPHPPDLYSVTRFIPSSRP